MTEKTIRKNRKSPYKSVIGQKSNKKENKKGKAGRIASGLTCGFINGFFGGGGGMVLVPTLIKTCKMDEKRAHATAIAVILPVSVLSGAVSSLGYGVDWGLLFPVAAGGVAGGLIGAQLIKKLSRNAIGCVFIIIMAAAGVRLAFF